MKRVFAACWDVGHWLGFPTTLQRLAICFSDGRAAVSSYISSNVAFINQKLTPLSAISICNSMIWNFKLVIWMDVSSTVDCCSYPWAAISDICGDFWSGSWIQLNGTQIFFLRQMVLLSARVGTSVSARVLAPHTSAKQGAQQCCCYYQNLLENLIIRARSSSGHVTQRHLEAGKEASSEST